MEEDEPTRAGNIPVSVGSAPPLTEAQLRALTDSLPDLAWTCLAAGPCDFLNRQWIEFTGIPEAEQLGYGWLHQIHEDDRERVKAEWAAAVHGGIAFDIEFRIRRADGVHRWFRTRAIPLRDSMGKIVKWYGSNNDIDDYKRAIAAHALLTTAIEQADEMILITDERGDITYVNPAFERVTGYSRTEVLGRNPRFLKSGRQDDGFYRELWATVHRGATWRGRLVNKKKDGSFYTQDTSISPVRDAAGATVSYVAVKRDVTAALALEAQFLQAQKLEAVGRLAGGVAHDFNNVLSVIMSYSEMICRDLPPDSPFATDMEEIRTAGARARALTRQLLAFSRQQVLETKVLDLNDQLAGLERMLTRLIGADVALTILRDSGLWPVKADPSQVQQILMNLAVNARDAMPEGGRLAIETSNTELDEAYARAHDGVRAGKYVLLTISDTGTGMGAETLARVFEPFFTTKETGKGTGLGLATVFGIVQQSMGHIAVSSSLGRGTTFRIYLPRFAGVAERVSLAPTEGPTERGDETILLVEDEDQVRVLARSILRRNGYVVLDAPNAGEALLICEQHPERIHLLLTDVVLPRMNGRQLAERLSAMRPEMKVLFMSGYTDDAFLHRGLPDSGVSFLQKPFTPTLLARKVRDVLADRAPAG
jgi:two-component system, cell cycle sensor histidine kinase and response regulator CckA